MTIRKTAVADKFYPASPSALATMVRGFLAQVKPIDGPTPKAIIAPHAGYPYSGPIAASAYARLPQAAFRRILLLGPAHTVPLRGIAASSATAFATPLGNVPIEATAVQASLALPQVQIMDEAHRREHGLEVQLPFLQLVCRDFAIVPLVVGEVETAIVAQLMQHLYTGPDTLIIVSSDLSHYYDYATAQKLDAATSQAIEQLRPEAVEHACGRFAIRGLLQFAQTYQWQVQTVDLRNSGDTGGTRDRVVGYGAYIFT